MRVLITGMSGTGKSTVIAELARRGYRAIDLDSPEFSQLVPAADGELTGVGGGMDWVWNVPKVAALLDAAGPEPLFVSGCSPNQGAFSSRFDRVVLLTAPTEVIRDRLAIRTSNDFGNDPAELERALALIAEIEPLLRRAADTVIDTSAPLEEVVARVLAGSQLAGSGS
jgi:dephospho-CoA kinase